MIFLCLIFLWTTVMLFLKYYADLNGCLVNRGLVNCQWSMVKIQLFYSF